MHQQGDPGNAAIKEVVGYEAYGDAENYTMAKKLGADDFLTKPVDFVVLKEKLKSFS
jgi:FixJ family two-component response regulator